ncbi:MAG: M23 family metallopeptidase [Leptolyngbyaceae cyanobacterium bins.59]|nr:M23 family metallopeptidase [Leptolyngbyaceae cyanobacterium bins.59]
MFELQFIHKFIHKSTHSFNAKQFSAKHNRIALFLTTLTVAGVAGLSWRLTKGVASEVGVNSVAPAMVGWQSASFPVENFQAYTSPFGYRSSPDGRRRQEFHRGLDMAAPAGSYIRNWWAGRVIEVSDDSSCGTSVVIQSGDWQHIYCHMKGSVTMTPNGKVMLDREGGIQIFEGQMVAAGARIGRVGMTGRTTGPHLHWGLKYAEQWVDPALVLRAMYAQQTDRGPISQQLR